ncbi:MAG: hypothetical protein JO256_08430, partial [Alphaproteobacteria bacterium]|nr:hypothetical protein [Alphaproteobacteria bacterium]
NLVPQGAYANAALARATPPRLAGDEGATHLPLIGSLIGLKSTKVPAEQFGLRNARPGPGVNVDHIAAHVTRVDINRSSGRFVVTLDNGQVWRQVADDDQRQSWRKDIVGKVATIAYGIGNTFNFSVGESQFYKVERVS